VKPNNDQVSKLKVLITSYNQVTRNTKITNLPTIAPKQPEKIKQAVYVPTSKS